MKAIQNFYAVFFLIIIAIGTNAQSISKVWVSDNGDGTYKNPVLYADYSDPDAIRVGEDFYMVSSSFDCVPGLPILHSKDLVNWNLIGHVFARQVPLDVFDKVQHGNGAWAPSIRYRNAEFVIYYPDPDYGIYLVKAKNPAGPWSEPLLVLPGKGFIDPCPFWDDNGNAYLIHAYAGSRAGIKSILTLRKMDSDGTKVLDEGVMVFDGHDNHPTLEGPKIYKRNGYYYIFAPAGGVTPGWQLVLRSKNIYGPYDEKIVMDQGKSTINGPHQGAWVETPNGESWFLHFQDVDAYGRVVHLNPMKWVNDWPVIGIDTDGDGKGEPVLTYKKPDVGKTYPKATPPESDEFDGLKLGLQWQWAANPKPYWAFPTGPKGYLRLFAYPLPENFINFWDVPNLLMQKFPAKEFTATSKLTFKPRFDGEKVGFIVMGYDYAYLSVRQDSGKMYLSYTQCLKANRKGKEIESARILLNNGNIYFRVKVSGKAICNFSYSIDGEKYTYLDNSFSAQPGQWIGAKVGLFCVRLGKINDAGFADVDWFRIE
jgi:beta-xylosidase